MTMQADLFFSFRSPYSYLALPQLERLLADYDLELRLRVVMPLAIRSPSFFKSNPLLPFYILRDTMRVAEYHGIPYRWPQPDPIVQDPNTLEIAAEQPYIFRLARLGACAAEKGDGFRFAREVAHTIWSGTVDGWHEGPHLGEAAGRAGFDFADLERAIAADPGRYDRQIEASEAALREVGHWGVPNLVYDGEPFWGQDRIELFRWRLEQNGLERRRR